MICFGTLPCFFSESPASKKINARVPAPRTLAEDATVANYSDKRGEEQFYNLPFVPLGTFCG